MLRHILRCPPYVPSLGALHHQLYHCHRTAPRNPRYGRCSLLKCVCVSLSLSITSSVTSSALPPHTLQERSVYNVPRQLAATTAESVCHDTPRHMRSLGGRLRTLGHKACMTRRACRDAQGVHAATHKACMQRSLAAKRVGSWSPRSESATSALSACAQRRGNAAMEHADTHAEPPGNRDALFAEAPLATVELRRSPTKPWRRRRQPRRRHRGPG